MSTSRSTVFDALLRRTAVFGAALASTVFAVRALVEVLEVNGLTWLELALVALFTINFSWIALSFWSSLAGFVALLFRWRAPGLVWPGEAAGHAPLTTRTALLLPVYNEDPARICANLEAMHESLAATGQADAFDIFVLSDSTDPDNWVAEELGWARLVQRTGGDGQVFYRKRRRNIAKKAGNIADFCRRWGRRYDFMVVLDADSVMTGDTLVRLVRLMQANPGAGIIQAPPAILGRGTLYARLQQFASGLYGPVFAAGQAFWQLGDGNYWGHNAIIRTRAFTDACGLPTLPGKAPFGGHILSHDFVEAALIRRAGWKVWMVPELGGSYEECPPTVIDFAQRDRRWCQGNLQHARVLPARGLHPVSRLHLLMGMLSYLSSPLWLIFLMVGVAAAVQEQLIEPVYFGPQESLFPLWPAYDWDKAVNLFLVAMGMLMAPKLLGVMLAMIRPRLARGFGGRLRILLGLVLETVFSALIAPVMMLFHSRFVLDILLGRDSGWGRQNRDGDALPLGVAVRRHAGHTLFGAALGATAWYVSMPLFWWLSPMVAGLLLAIPLSWISAQPALGRLTQRLGLFAVPEENVPPPVLRRAAAIEQELAGAEGASDAPEMPERGLARIVADPAAHALHLSLLPAHSDWDRGDPAVLEAARDKLAAVPGDTAGARLTAAETMAVLFDPDTLAELRMRAPGNQRAGVEAA